MNLSGGINHFFRIIDNFLHMFLFQLLYPALRRRILPVLTLLIKRLVAFELKSQLSISVTNYVNSVDNLIYSSKIRCL